MLKLNKNQSHKSNSKHLTIKVPHLAKKINIQYNFNELIKELVTKIEMNLGVKEINFGLLVKDNKGNENFLADNEILSNIKFYQNKASFVKKCRTLFFETPDPKKLQIINSKKNQTNFLKLLIKNDFQSIVNILKEGFDPNYIINGEPLLFHAISNETAAPLLTSLLISYNAHIDYVSPIRQTALHKAVRVNKPDIVKFLLQLGAAANSKDENGLTALYYSIIYTTHTMCLNILLAAGAKIGARNNKGLTEIHQACLLGKLDHLRVLINAAGANVNLPTNSPDKSLHYHGNTPLHYAVSSRNWHIVQFLVSMTGRVDIYCQNHAGQTPLDLLTVQNGNEQQLNGENHHEEQQQFEYVRQLLTYGRVIGKISPGKDSFLSTGIKEEKEENDDEDDDDRSSISSCLRDEITKEKELEEESRMKNISDNKIEKNPSPETSKTSPIKEVITETLELDEKVPKHSPTKQEVQESEVTEKGIEEEKSKETTEVFVGKDNTQPISKPDKQLVDDTQQSQLAETKEDKSVNHQVTPLSTANKSPDKENDVVKLEESSPLYDHLKKCLYFGLDTQMIELTRTREHGWGFGFRIETDYCKEEQAETPDGDNNTSRFEPSPEKPSCHRLNQAISSSPIKLDIPEKPYLLEVNGASVNTMPHSDLTQLINGIHGKIMLLVTYSTTRKHSTSSQSKLDLLDQHTCSPHQSPSKYSPLPKSLMYSNVPINPSKLNIDDISSHVTSLFGGFGEFSPNQSPCCNFTSPSPRLAVSQSFTNVTKTPNKTPTATNCQPILAAQQKDVSPLSPIVSELEEDNLTNYCILDYDNKEDNCLPYFMNVECPNSMHQINSQNQDALLFQGGNKASKSASRRESDQTPIIHRSGVILKLGRSPSIPKNKNTQSFYQKQAKTKASSKLHSSEINIPIII